MSRKMKMLATKGSFIHFILVIVTISFCSINPIISIAEKTTSSSTDIENSLEGNSVPNKSSYKFYAYGILWKEMSGGKCKQDEKATEFVDTLRDFERFQNERKTTNNPINYFTSKIREFVTKRKALKLMNKEYKTQEVRKLLRLK